MSVKDAGPTLTLRRNGVLAINESGYQLLRRIAFVTDPLALVLRVEPVHPFMHWLASEESPLRLVLEPVNPAVTWPAARLVRASETRWEACVRPFLRQGAMPKAWGRRYRLYGFRVMVSGTAHAYLAADLDQPLSWTRAGSAA